MKKATAGGQQLPAQDAESWVVRGDWVDVDTSSDLTADTRIDALPERHARGYDLLTAIPVHFEIAADNVTVIAHFREARLSMSGTDHEDAKTGLLDWILDSFDDLESAVPGTMGDDLERQMQVLRTHLRCNSYE